MAQMNHQNQNRQNHQNRNPYDFGQVKKVIDYDIFEDTFDVPNEGELKISVRVNFLAIVMTTFCLPRDRISSLKKKIISHHYQSYKPFHLRLFFAGVKLSDHRTFSHYKIPRWSTIDLMFQDPRTQLDIYVGNSINRIPLCLSARTTIHKVKALFSNHTCISTDNLKMLYHGRVLQDNHTLAYYCVNYKSTLKLLDERRTAGLRITIFVRISSTAKQLELQVDFSCTINDLKAIIQDHENIPAHLQTLFLPQKRLQGGSSTLLDNHVHGCSIIHLVHETCLS